MKNNIKKDTSLRKLEIWKKRKEKIQENSYFSWSISEK
jgi:hypothetical protein